MACSRRLHRNQLPVRLWRIERWLAFNYRFNAVTVLTTTYRVKAYLTKAGHCLLDQRLDEQRLLYNAALEERMTAWRIARLTVTNKHQNRELTAIRKDLQEYGAVHRRVSAGTLDRIDRAYRLHMRSLAEVSKRIRGEAGEPQLVRWDALTSEWKPRFGRPRFKGRERFRTLEAHAGNERFLRRSDNGCKGYIRIKGLPRLQFRWDSRIPVGPDGAVQQPLYIRVTRTPKRVSICMTYPLGEAPEIAETPPTNPVGLHHGVAQRMTSSEGPNHLLMETRQFDRGTRARLQRKMARRRQHAIVNGHASWERTANGRFRYRWNSIDLGNPDRGHHGQGYRKVQSQLAKLSQSETDVDRGLLHEVSTRLVKTHDAICVESPDIQAMTRSAAGDEENPGEGVALQRHLNRSVREQAWGTFVKMLEYKAARAGVPFVKVPSPYMSQTCHRCGVADPVSRRDRAHFRCAHCGFDGDAEENAARNVLTQGLAMLGFGTGGTLPQRRSARDSTAGLPAVASENRRAWPPDHSLRE